MSNLLTVIFFPWTVAIKNCLDISSFHIKNMPSFDFKIVGSYDIDVFGNMHGSEGVAK